MKRLRPARTIQAPAEGLPFHGFHDASLPDPLIGRTLGTGHAIERRIGSGGTASVYAASGEDGALVAVKIASGRLDSSLANRVIENETSLLGSLGHGNIVGCLGGGSLDGRRFMMLEYLEGQTLFHATEMGKRMSWERARGVLLQLCDALEYVHSKGLVHRDVKTGNVFLQDEGRVKLLDFGIASRPNARELVPSNMAPGTVTYMAPEIIMQERYDHRADIYSLGVMMYKMLCGVAPFIGSVKEVLLMHVSREPASPREIHPYLDIPHDLDSIVIKALQKEPGMRFSDVAQMRDAISSCVVWPRELALMDGMDWARIVRLADDTVL